MIPTDFVIGAHMMVYTRRTGVACPFTPSHMSEEWGASRDLAEISGEISPRYEHHDDGQSQFAEMDEATAGFLNCMRARCITISVISRRYHMM